MIQLFQQRDFGNKLNVTFQYLGQNFRSFGTAILYIVGPVALVAGIMSGILQSKILSLSDDVSLSPAATFRLLAQFVSPAFWLTVLSSILANLMVSLTTYAHLKCYDRLRGGYVPVAEVWAEVKPAIGRGLVISVLSSIVIFFGFMFFFLPGIYLAVVLSLALAITSFEGTDFGPTWERCFKLIRDKWFSTFGLIIVVGIIVVVMSLVFAIPSGIISVLVTAKMLPDTSGLWVVVANVINTMGSTLLYSIIYLAIGFQYTNLVERQEGRGLIGAIDTIGTASTQPRPTDEGDF